MIEQKELDEYFENKKKMVELQAQEKALALQAHKVRSALNKRVNWHKDHKKSLMLKAGYVITGKDKTYPFALDKTGSLFMRKYMQAVFEDELCAAEILTSKEDHKSIRATNELNVEKENKDFIELQCEGNEFKNFQLDKLRFSQLYQIDIPGGRIVTAKCLKYSSFYGILVILPRGMLHLETKSHLQIYDRDRLPYRHGGYIFHPSSCPLLMHAVVNRFSHQVAVKRIEKWYSKMRKARKFSKASYR